MARGMGQGLGTVPMGLCPLAGAYAQEAVPAGWALVYAGLHTAYTQSAWKTD